MSNQNQPAVVPPEPKEKGRKPDPFERKEDYQTFCRNLAMYLYNNRGIYDNDAKRIVFALGFMTKGVPGQWAQTFFEKVVRRARAANRDPEDADWGTWEAFWDALAAAFSNPSKEKEAYNQMELHQYDPKLGIDDFFQKLDLYSMEAGYASQDKYLINLIETKLPKNIIRQVYNGTAIPATYAAYKTRVIEIDNLDRRFRTINAVTHRHYNPSLSHPSSSDKHTATGVIYGGGGQAMDLDRNRRGSTSRNPKGRKLFDSRPKNTCFNCGKEGHWANKCPEPKKKRVEIRALFDALDDEDKALLQDFLKG